MAMSKRDQNAMEQQGAEIVRLRGQVAAKEAELARITEIERKEVSRLQNLRTHATGTYQSLQSLGVHLQQMARESQHTTTRVALEATGGYVEITRNALDGAIQASYR